MMCFIHKYTYSDEEAPSVSAYISFYKLMCRVIKQYKNDITRHFIDSTLASHIGLSFIIAPYIYCGLPQGMFAQSLRNKNCGTRRNHHLANNFPIL